MGLADYGFAFFIFLLACTFALLCKYLFGRTKNRLQALDEKEKKLLALYSTLEDMMDEFNDSALQANGELAHHITEMRNVAASLRNSTASQPAAQAHTAQAHTAQAQISQPTVQAPRQQAPTAQARHRNTAPPRQNASDSGFEAPLFEVVNETPSGPQAPLKVAKINKTEADRPARILALHKNGMERLHIAKELSVTLSEVDLVLGIAGQK